MIMALYNRIPPPVLHLFRLTLQRKGKLGNIYSLGENTQDAFQRYIARIVKLRENAAEIEFIDGDLANPHAHPDQ